MSRELKFRSYAYTPGRGYFMDYSENYGGLGAFFREYDSEQCSQYTGLKDAHGKEIYEGDVVLSLIPGGLQKVVRFEIKDIYRVYGMGDYGTDRTAGYCLSGYWGGPDKLEIIGNIYENPDLLK